MTKDMGQEDAKASRKPRADSLRNRERLLAAATEVFRAGGPEASLEAVARRAEVGIGTLYRHFPTRDTLFEAVYRRDVDELADLAEVLSASEPPGEALRLWMHRAVDVVATKKGMLAALTVATEGRQELYAYTSGRMHDAARGLLERAVAAGAVRDDVTPEDLLHAFVGMSSTRPRPDWREAVTRVLDIFVDGLAPRHR